MTFHWCCFQISWLVFVGIIAPSNGYAQQKEPSYQGRTLSEWLILRAENRRIPGIHAAIRSIGTDAVPYLIRWIQYEEPPTNRPGLLADPGTTRATGAMLAFEILGERAASAVQPLSNLVLRTRLTNDAQRLVGVRATLALPWLGPQALPPLLDSVKDPRNLVPNVAAEAIGNMGSNARPAIPVLIESASSTNGGLAWRAMDSLGKLRLEPDLVVPALVQQLSHRDPFYRMCAAESLGRLGTMAAKAEPALRSLLTGTNANVLQAVNAALLQVTATPRRAAP